MKYVVFLRGINVGGNNIIKMADLKKTFDDAGYENVLTFIQSGNVILETPEKDLGKITLDIEKMLAKKFGYELRVVVLSHDQLKKVLTNATRGWETREDVRRYIAFVKPPTTPDEVMKELTPKQGVDFVERGEGVVYMTSRLKYLTKSGLNKIAATKIYKEVTIRNYTTIKKMLLKMESI